MQKPLLVCLLPLVFSFCQSQNKSTFPVGGGCDGCELMYLGMPETIAAVDTSVGWAAATQRLIVNGTVFQIDGRTPVPNVIVYYWQTDDQGYYSNSSKSGLANTRHGARRGWLKTGADGKYSLYTNRPAAYPDRDFPAHIHLAIKESDIADEYYVDELVFDDDPLLTTAKRKALENRGGTGVLRLKMNLAIQIAQHDIILGLHIPNYPNNKSSKLRTGLSIGEESPSFTPYHAWGPDRGTKACPVCKYGRNFGVLYFSGSADAPEDLRKWLGLLEKRSLAEGGNLKVYLVKETRGNPEAIIAMLEQMARELDIRELTLTVVPDFADAASEVNLNRIDPAAANTFIVYQNRVVIDKYTNLSPTRGNFTHLVGKIRR